MPPVFFDAKPGQNQQIHWSLRGTSIHEDGNIISTNLFVIKLLHPIIPTH